MTPTHRLGLLAAAIAAVSLTSSCDDSSDNGPGSLKITTENAPFVAADGAALVAATMDAEAMDAAPPAGVVVTATSTQSRGQNFIALGELVRSHMEAGATAAQVSAGLPVGATVVTGTTVECDSGNYVYFSNATSWGITYNNCVEEDGTYSNTLSGTATGTYTEVGYGGWTSDYENLRNQYRNVYDGGSYSGDYTIDGSFEWSQDGGYGGYGGYYTGTNYTATDLTVKYKYKATGESAGEEREGAGTIVYETYDFSFYHNAGFWFWEGQLYARDSERGIWSISTPVPFGVNYACGLVTGEIRYSGVIHDDHEESETPRGSNVLIVSGNGINDTVTYDLFEADGVTEISSETHDWLDYYSEYENEGCE